MLPGGDVSLMRSTFAAVVLSIVLFGFTFANSQTNNMVALADKVCGSAAARVAAQKMEAEITQDPNGKALMSLPGMPGMKAETGEGQLVKLESVNTNRMYPGKTPDSFVCQGKFVHRNTGLTPQEENDAAAKMTAEMANEMLVNHTPYFNHYQVTPLGGNEYKLRLIPGGLELSKEYVSEFTYH
jgi:hypothetical protein